MELKKISSLFERYQKILVPPQASVEKKAAEIISTCTNITITADQITYAVASKTLSLNVPSVIKSEIFRQKSDILELLQQEMGVKNAPKVLR